MNQVARVLRQARLHCASFIDHLVIHGQADQVRKVQFIEWPTGRLRKLHALQGPQQQCLQRRACENGRPHPLAHVEISPRLNAVFDTEPDVYVGEKRQLGLSRRQLIVALLHQAADALNRVLTAYIFGRGDFSEIPAHERRGKDSSAAGEFEIFNGAEVDQLSRYFVEESQQRVNFGTIGMRDGAPIEFIAVRAE
jgi:hypothetical protein